MISSIVKVSVVAFAVVTGILLDRVHAPVTPTVSVDSPVVVSSTKITPKGDEKKTILRLILNPARVVYLDSEVTNVSINEAIRQLKALDTSTEPVYLLINSPGGSVLDGMQLITQMEGMQAPVYTVCTKICASMAAFIHQYGVKRYSLDRSYLMFHPASGGAEGQVLNVLSMLGTLQKSLDKMNAYIAHRSKVSLEVLEKTLAYQMWVDGEDANAFVINLKFSPTTPVRTIN